MRAYLVEGQHPAVKCACTRAMLYHEINGSSKRATADMPLLCDVLRLRTKACPRCYRPNRRINNFGFASLLEPNHDGPKSLLSSASAPQKVVARV